MGLNMHGGNGPYKAKIGARGVLTTLMKNWKPQRFLRAVVAMNITKGLYTRWKEHIQSNGASLSFTQYRSKVSRMRTWVEQEEVVIMQSVFQLNLIMLHVKNGRQSVDVQLLPAIPHKHFVRLQTTEECGDHVSKEHGEDKFIIMVRCVITRACTRIQYCALYQLVVQH
jgi:hypothetical protein